MRQKWGKWCKGITIYIGMPLKIALRFIVFLAGYAGKNAPKHGILAQKNPAIPGDCGRIAEQDLLLLDVHDPIKIVQMDVPMVQGDDPIRLGTRFPIT